MWLDPSKTAIETLEGGNFVITSGTDSSDLSISSVGASRAGRYTCVVTAGRAEQGNTIDITVQCKEDTCNGSYVVLVGVCVVKWLMKCSPRLCVGVSSGEVVGKAVNQGCVGGSP